MKTEGIGAGGGGGVQGADGQQAEQQAQQLLSVQVQVVQLDYYMARGADGFEHPVIRIFGPTDVGQKTTVHVHGVYPYLYFRPKLSADDALFESREWLARETKGAFRDKLHEQLKWRINKKNNGNNNNSSNNNNNNSSGSSNINSNVNNSNSSSCSRNSSEFIHDLEIVECTNLYGYQPDKQLFVKLSYRDPRQLYDIVNALQSDRLLGAPMQPFEAHLPFILQFTSDFNIRPMGWMELAIPLTPVQAQARIAPISPSPQSQTLSLTLSPTQRKGLLFRARAPFPRDKSLFPPPSLSQEENVMDRIYQSLVYRDDGEGTEIGEQALFATSDSNSMTVDNGKSESANYNKESLSNSINHTPSSEHISVFSPNSTGSPKLVSKSPLNGYASSTSSSQTQKSVVSHNAAKNYSYITREAGTSARIVYLSPLHSSSARQTLQSQTLSLSASGGGAATSTTTTAAGRGSAGGGELGEEGTDYYNAYQADVADGSSPTYFSMKILSKLNELNNNVPPNNENKIHPGLEFLENDAELLKQFLSQSDKDCKPIDPLAKSSTSELEFDVDCSLIVICDDRSFGSELLEEEANRREAKGLAAYKPVDELFGKQGEALNVNRQRWQDKVSYKEKRRKLDALIKKGRKLKEAELARATASIAPSAASSPLSPTAHDSFHDSYNTFDAFSRGEQDEDGIFAAFIQRDQDEETEKKVRADRIMTQLSQSESHQPQLELINNNDNDSTNFVLLDENNILNSNPDKVTEDDIDSDCAIDDFEEEDKLMEQQRKRKEEEEEEENLPPASFHKSSTRKKEERDKRRTSQDSDDMTQTARHIDPQNEFTLEKFNRTSKYFDHQGEDGHLKKKIYYLNNNSGYTKPPMASVFRRKGSATTPVVKAIANEMEKYTSTSNSNSVSINVNSYSQRTDSTEIYSPPLSSAGVKESPLGTSRSSVLRALASSGVVNVLITTIESPPGRVGLENMPFVSQEVVGHDAVNGKSVESKNKRSRVNVPGDYSGSDELAPLRDLITRSSHLKTSSFSCSNSKSVKYLFPVQEAPNRSAVERYVQHFHGTQLGGGGANYSNRSIPLSNPILPIHPTSILPIQRSVINSSTNSNLYQVHTRNQLASQLNRNPAMMQSNGLFPQKTNFAMDSQSPFKTKLAAANKSKLAAKKFSSKKSFGRKHRITLMSIELLVRTKSNEETEFSPNCDENAIEAVFWTLEDRVTSAETEVARKLHGIILTMQDKPNLSKEDYDVKQVLDLNLHMLKSCGLYKDTICEIVESEKDLFDAFLHVVRVVDPDIFVGYDVERYSLGYLIKRAKTAHVGLLDIEKLLSRVPTCTFDKMKGSDKYPDTESGIAIKGRIVLNGWRRMQDELKLTCYTISNVAEHVLNVKMPVFSFKQLTNWFNDKRMRQQSIEHLQQLCHLTVLLFDKLDIVRRTGECARLFGIDFYSVITRGSQYRVEAALLKRCKASEENFVLISPTKADVANQGAMAALPLVMEPRSGFYKDPVVVLDYQSLYPSIMIAYNLCFSTCFGKLNKPNHNPNDPSRPDTIGRIGICPSYKEARSAAVAYLHHQNVVLAAAQGKKCDQDNMHDGEVDLSDANMPFMSSDGVLFVSKSVRLGILPQLLKELLDCRNMIKASMKLYESQNNINNNNNDSGSSNNVLLRNLDARQLAIKLLMNVTYGYTSASFSGRMPMSELADAIVMTGRDHLNHAKLEIDFSRDRRCNCSRDRNSDSNSNSDCSVSHNSNSDSYNSNSNSSNSSSVSLSCNCSNVWDRAKVVYGDTDSVFIQLPNRSKAEAFKIGAEIAGYISSLCPGVMKLKFEKVYTNSVLVSKKRYVGEKYESLGQKKGELEAKGIEMVRRDQCPLVMMVQEAALKIFFETRDLVKLKDFLVSQWSLILQGKLTSKEFIFRREVKSNYVASYEPPGKVLVMKKTKADPAYVCPYAWRVPYVSVVPPGDVKSPLLVDLAKSPEEFLRRGSNYRLNYIYYIMKCLNPALSRVFSLGDLASCVDIQKWYAEMPKIKVAPVAIKYDTDGGSGHGNDTRGSGSSSSSSSNFTVTTNTTTSGSDRRGGHQSQLQISSFLASICLVCGGENVCKPEVLCVSCLQNPQGSYSILLQRWNRTQESEHKLMLVCQHCSKHRQAADSLIRGRLIGKDACENVDCRFFHERLKKVNDLDKLMFLLKKMLLDW